MTTLERLSRSISMMTNIHSCLFSGKRSGNVLKNKGVRFRNGCFLM